MKGKMCQFKMTNKSILSVTNAQLKLLLVRKNLGENSNQLTKFVHKFWSVSFYRDISQQTQPAYRFFSFFSAYVYAVKEFFTGRCLIRFYIVSTNTCSRTQKLIKENLDVVILGKASNKIKHRFRQTKRSVRQVISFIVHWSFGNWSLNKFSIFLVKIS